MPAIAPTVANATEFAGAYKVLVVTATLTSNDDSITLVAATHGIRTIAKVDAQITLGMDANCQTVWTTFAGLVIRLRSLNAAGAAAVIGGDETVSLLILGY